MEKELLKIAEILSAMDDNDVIEFSDGSKITVKEYKQAFSEAKITLTDRALAGGTDGRPRTGQADFWNKSITLSLDSVKQWEAAFPQSGLAFVLLHEVAHLTLKFEILYNNNYAIYLDRAVNNKKLNDKDRRITLSQYVLSPEARATEASVDSLANFFLQAMGRPSVSR